MKIIYSLTFKNGKSTFKARIDQRYELNKKLIKFYNKRFGIPKKKIPKQSPSYFSEESRTSSNLLHILMFIKQLM